ncbi:hypothetical protein V6N12_008067 [Hibiscus sabdariffa]|uniref:Uncharacterized protein n=1 Tax=Hibiscus sabdariffa TaxID=183260 RepID=A0ABR2BSV5_9ROSI
MEETKFIKCAGNFLLQLLIRCSILDGDAFRALSLRILSSISTRASSLEEISFWRAGVRHDAVAGSAVGTRRPAVISRHIFMSNVVEKGTEVDDLPERKSGSDSLSENDTKKEKKAIEDMMSMRVKKGILSKDEQKASRGKPLTPTEEEHRRRILMMQRVQDSPTSGSGSTRIFISLEGRVGSSCSWWSADG